jgi:hypothetical protein
MRLRKRDEQPDDGWRSSGVASGRYKDVTQQVVL